ncbi:MAG: enoyl-CoA hydratase [Burkholderiaceae bacterium]|nr:enoyl-CoA hydratase [Burkholderiaceae bacterium]MBT9504715.1 enoyl-CoA hydratase [Burkholderiaceae bacterium]
MPAELRIERFGSTMLLTLSDPATRNTLSPQIYAAFVEALNYADAEDQVRCVVLTGDGGHFCSGGNLQRLVGNRAAGPQVQTESIERFHELVEALRAFPKPVIAAVEGAAAGAGFSLALTCDLLVAAKDARFVLSYGRVGLSPDGGAVSHLMQALPRSQVMQLMLLAEPIGAEQLHRQGVVNYLTEPGQALTQALELAERLGQMAPNAMASAKDLVHKAQAGALRQHLALERDHFVNNLFHDNGGEGIEAFFARRPPLFK